MFGNYQYFRAVGASCECLVAIAALLALVSLASSSREGENYDPLPGHVIPTHYDISIETKLQSAGYRGEILIHADIVDESRNQSRCELKLKKKDDFGLNLIMVNLGSNVEILETNITSILPKEKSKIIGIAETRRHPSTQAVKFMLKQMLSPGTKIQLRIVFKVVTAALTRGISQEPGLLVSQFQGSDVRYALPSMDDPCFKASVSLSLVVFDQSQTAVAGTNVETVDSEVVQDKYRTITTFERLPPMNLNSLGFAVGDLEKLEGKTRSNVVVEIYTPVRKSGFNYALETTIRAIEWMEEYTGVAYPLKKFGLVMVPNHNKGNTESFGLATIRASLAYMDEERDDDMRLQVVVNVAHVIAHQWFGNIVSMDRWEDFWVTEGAAGYLAYEMAKAFMPNFDVDSYVRSNTLNEFIAADADRKFSPLSPHRVRSGIEIDGIFSEFQFAKSSSLFAILAKFLGKKQLREGLRAFARNPSDSPVHVDQFFEALEQSTNRTGLASMFKSWVKLRGQPEIIMVKLDDDTGVALYQEPTYETLSWIDRKKARNHKDLWTVPVTVQFSNGRDKNDSIDVVLKQKNDETIVGAPKWFNFSDPEHYVFWNPENDLSAFYRVRLDGNLYKKLERPIENKSLPAKSRIKLLDDTRYLVKRSHVVPHRFNDLIKHFQNETHGGVLLSLYPSTRNYSRNPNSLWQEQNQTSPFIKFFETHRFEANGSEDFYTRKGIEMIYKWLVGDEQTQMYQAALKKFEETDRDLPVFLRSPVYSAVVKYGSKSSADKLLERSRTTKYYDEQARIAKALIESRPLEYSYRVQHYTDGVLRS